MSTATTAVTPVGNSMDLTDSTALAAGVGVTATECGGRLVAPVGAGGGLVMPWGYPPINLIYQHFHNSIRAELDALSELAKGLDGAAGAPLEELLQSLRVRYQFMEQVYRYHSSVEDEVVYPALDSKVKNVTLAYSVEHEDEEHLFDQLTHLLAAALSERDSARSATVRYLLEKIEQIHTTVRKHLAKEEEQLFPLLLAHFSHVEQAQLVAEFLCTIPLAAVEQVLSWLKPNVPAREQQDLLVQVCSAIQDKLLGKLLAEWLTPLNNQAGQSADVSADVLGGKHQPVAADLIQNKSSSADGKGEVVGAQDPVLLLRHIHQAIRSALKEFAEETRSLQAQGAMHSTHLSSLVEQHRFLRAVCTFHSQSENDTMLPVALRFAASHTEVAASIQKCEEEHVLEAANFDALGRLLVDVRSCTRRGGKEANELANELCKSAEAVRVAFDTHMLFEETELLPVLAKLCPVNEQRLIVWNTIRAMPLRLLERVLPWVSSQVSEEECTALLDTMRLAGAEAAEPEAISGVLVQLLVKWAERGRGASPRQMSVSKDGQDESPPVPSPKRRRTMEPPPLPSDCSAHQESIAAQAGPSFVANDTTAGSGSINPIDHIFQFHKALRREVRHLEQDAQALSRVVESGGAVEKCIQQLEGRFQFLKGIYIAHSEAEDRIVFPALEKKEILRNVSHAYSLDHQKEQEMFSQVELLLQSVKEQKDNLEVLGPLSSRLRVTCAAVRANLETHVRSEETELWPLFNEHFTVSEQEQIVGSIVGHTGAEVLQTMISWVAKETNPEEQAAMMDALRSATRNTRFDKWLSNIIDSAQEGNVDEASAGSDVESDVGVQMELAEVAGFLVEASGTTAESAAFRPGWEDIFLINQQQLEGAVRRVSNDPNLEPTRKAYIIQSIMASRYIVAQQRRLNVSSTGTGSSSMASTPTTTSPSVSFPTVPLDGSCMHHQPGHSCQHASTSSGQASYPPVPPGTHGCRHYERKCSLVAPCCGKVYPCRLCHDEENDHKMDRCEVKEMVCNLCHQRQPVSGSCAHCNQTMARYYCSICHLFDDKEGRDIYHCPSCNVCRRGKGLGIDFFHCMKCNSCMSLSLFEKHICREQSLEGNCAVCHEYLFDSPMPIKELPCSHFMHSSCFQTYTRYNYTCPICAKSMGDMRVYFQMLDALVASERLPPEYASRTQNILCNDCSRQSAVQYHFVYHSCTHCGSYNTRVL